MESSDFIPFTSENLEYIVATYADDLKGFLNDVIGIEVLDKWQEELCDLVQAGHRRIAIASCNGSGKSYIVTAIELWWVITKPDATVSCCSATYTQLVDIHMRLLRKHIKDSLIPDYYCTDNSMKITLPGSGDEAFIAAVPNNQSRPEAIQGRHHGWLLAVFDEASGIHKEIYDAQEGNMTTETSFWIVIGNPICPGTSFHEIFKGKDSRWVTMHIDARDCLFTPKEWWQGMIDTYGLDDDRVRARVLGQFPRGAINSVVAERDYDAAEIRYREWKALDVRTSLADPVVIGLDVSRSIGRDSTVICARSGPILLDIREIVHSDNYDLAEKAHAYFNQWNAVSICIDYTGGYGAGPGDILKRMLPKGCIFQVEFAGKPSESGRWLNKRAELWMKLGAWMQTALIPTIPRLRKDSLDVEWWHTPKELIQVESKDDMRARGKDSPDWSDAVGCSLYIDPKPASHNGGDASRSTARAVLARARIARKGGTFA